MTMGMYAQSVTTLWSEDFSSYSKDDVPSGGTYNYVCANGKSATKIYAETLAGGTAPELLVSKNGGAFTATVPTQGISGEVNLQFKTNKAITVSIDEKNVTVTRTGNDNSCVANITAGTESVVIVFSNSTSSNIRLDNIQLFQGTAKKAPGLSWGTASREVTLGAEDNNFPTLTNGNNLAVTYDSSEKSVATIDETGKIILIAAGKTTITASFAGNDEFEEGSVSYTLTVKEAASSETNTPETAYTVAEALQKIADGTASSAKVYIKGKISQITEVSTSFGNATYFISDDGTTATQLEVFRGYYIDGERFATGDQIKVGDNVVVYGVLTKYQEKSQVKTGSSIYSHNGKTTGIDKIQIENTKATPVYNMAGQRVNKDAKGLVIKNGKKVLVK